MTGFPFLGLSRLWGTYISHLLQETYSASFLKPMARRFVGVPLVPFQRWVFQGSGWEERTTVTAVRKPGSYWKMLRIPGGCSCPAMPNPQPLKGMIL